MYQAYKVPFSLIKAVSFPFCVGACMWLAIGADPEFQFSADPE